MGSSVSVAGGRYALGLLALAVIVASLAWAAVCIRRRWLPAWGGAPARLAEIITGLGLLVLEMEILGAVGLFRLLPLVVVSICIGLGTHWAVPGNADATPRAARSRGSVARERFTSTGVIAAAAAVAVAAEWAGPTFSAWDYGIRSFDSLWYHLPWAADFAQSGQILTLHFTDVEYLTPFYPATAELVHALGIVAFTRDILSPGLNLLWLGLVLLGAFCVGRPNGRGPLTLLGAALAMAVPMILLSQAGSAANDVVGVAFVVAAVALYVNAEGSRAALVLGGVSAGLAVGTKLSMLASVLALTIGVLVLAPRGRRGSDALAWLVPLVAAGGFWYLRNLIAVGNPLPWVNLPGLAVPAAPLQAHTGFSVAHYLLHPHAWRGLLEPGLAAGFGPWWWAILTAVVIGPLLCLLPGAGARVRMLGLVALASIVAYLITPETAAGPDGHPLGFAFNLRYCAPALALALIVLPLGPPFARRSAQLALAAVLALILAVTLTEHGTWSSPQLIGQILVAVAVLIALAVALLRRPRVSAALAGVALLAVCVLGFTGQRHYLRSRYAYQPGISHLSRLWEWFRTVHDSRVGLTGTFGGFFSYPLYGVTLSNRVQYIAAHGPSGSFKPIRRCATWRSSVNGLHLRYVVITPNRDPWRPMRLLRAPEPAWIAGDPAARIVFAQRANGQPVSVYELEGPLDPRSCA